MRSVNDWIDTTRAAFAEGIPNGWILGWDRARFAEEIAACARPWKFFNATSFDYARCNKNEIDCRDIDYATEATSYHVLTVLVSFVVNTFITHWTCYTKGGRSGATVPRPEDRTLNTLEDAIVLVLEGKGLERMPADIYRTRMDGILLELSEPDEVTIGKCCFEDFDG
jgi:hypothetical protein